jgi:hypothetical protein
MKPRAVAVAGDGWKPLCKTVDSTACDPDSERGVSPKPLLGYAQTLCQVASARLGRALYALAWVRLHRSRDVRRWPGRISRLGVDPPLVLL